MHSIHLSNQRSFAAHPGETILESARRAGLMLEHSCKTGRCGTCRAKRLAGLSDAIGADLVLTREERADGWLLTCEDTALSDLWLDIEDLGPVEQFDLKTVPARIDALRRLSPDVMEVRLRTAPSANFGYLPGQYINVTGPGGVQRSYSIANAPSTSSTTIFLHVRRIDGGSMSRYWFVDAREGDLLRFRGPYGTLFLRAAGDRDLVLLATGTGIAPIRALLEGIEQLPDAERPRSILLLWGGRVHEDLYWDPTRAERMPPTLRFEPVLSRAPVEWDGERGYVQDVYVRSFLSSRPIGGTVVYACGSPTMIDAARQTLAACGLPHGRFHADAFVASSQVQPLGGRA